MAPIPKGTKRLISALSKLSGEPDSATREALLEAGFKKFIKWFTMAAKMIKKKKIVLPKQTQTFMEKHKNDVSQLASSHVDMNTKRQLILKRGGSGFLGGVIIRSFLRWDGKKKTGRRMKTTKTTRVARTRPTAAVRPSPQPRRKGPRTKITKRKALNDKFVTRRRRQQQQQQQQHQPTTPSPVSTVSGRLITTPITTPRFSSQPVASAASTGSGGRTRTPASTPRSSSRASSNYMVGDVFQFSTQSPTISPLANISRLSTPNKSTPQSASRRLVFSPLAHISPLSQAGSIGLNAALHNLQAARRRL